MPFTGLDFYNLLAVKTDEAYTGYFDNTKINRLVREATHKAISAKIATNDRLSVQGDLFGIYKTNATYTPVSNEVDLIIGGTGIDDYFQIMHLKALFPISLTGNYITTATNTSPIRITMFKDTNLRTGEMVSISGVTTNTNTNGVRYVKRLKNEVFELYSDINLLTPVTGNGAYTGTSGVVSKLLYNTGFNIKGGRKFSYLNPPTPQDPEYEIADTVLKIYPLTLPCSEITVDYVSTPVYIDVPDNTIDLLETYSERFIEYLCDQTALLMGLSMRDIELVNQETIEQSKP